MTIPQAFKRTAEEKMHLISREAVVTSPIEISSDLIRLFLALRYNTRTCSVSKYCISDIAL